MKAVLALIAIYVVAFIIATQGPSQNPVQASTPTDNLSVVSKSGDPAKIADLKSLLEFIGAKEQLRSVVNESAVQYRERLKTNLAANAADSNSRLYVNQADATYQQNFDQQRALQQIAGIYDKHYSEEEVRGLLEFFSSPLGQKFAAEAPKIAKEISIIQSAAAANAAHDSLQALQSESANVDKTVEATSGAKTRTALEDEMKPVSARP